MIANDRPGVRSTKIGVLAVTLIVAAFTSCAGQKSSPRTVEKCLPPPADTYKEVDPGTIDGGVGPPNSNDGGYSILQCEGYCQPDIADLIDCRMAQSDGGPFSITSGQSMVIQCHYVHGSICY